jgi:pyruvate kinase
VSYAALCKDVGRGDTLLLDDGNLSLTVSRVRAPIVRCRVERGGELTDHKGINIPGKRLSAAALTPKDRRDLRLAVEMGADWLAVSFVRRAADVVTARRLLKRAGREIPVMAKIERPEAIDDLEAILEASDGLMVARGDLAVELSPEKVPNLQKEIIDRASAVGKPVVTATQMLESMRNAPRPTRAEASDVANAILDGSSGLLLTAETAVGRYPVETIRMMARIIAATEASGRARRAEDPAGPLSIAETACLAASRAAEEVGARRVVVFTESGFTAREVARFRPRVPIVAFTPHEEVRRRLAPVWGVRSRRLTPFRSTDALMNGLERALVDGGLAERGDTVVVLLGLPLGVAGTTNLIKIHEVGSFSSRRPR